MLLNEIKPVESLAALVRFYRIIDFEFAHDINIPVKMYSPRPEHCLQFYLRDTETVSYPTDQQVVSGKRAVLSGQHTLLQHRQIGHSFLSIQVVFQPTALFRLTGIALTEITNQYLDARDVFGSEIDFVTEKIAKCRSHGDMIRAVEEYLGSLAGKMKNESHRVDLSPSFMLQAEECFRLDRFLKESCMSHRQFDRKFRERLGISPKQYLQVIRFDKAFRLKNRQPRLDWLSVAIRCGYHDYQHLVKDYKQFTGYTPPGFFAFDNNAPERAFGDAEI